MNRIREIRKEQHISQDELAKALNISRQAISHYERGDREPKLATWEKISNYFNVPVWYVQGLENISYKDLKKTFNKIRSKENNEHARIKAWDALETVSVNAPLYADRVEYALENLVKIANSGKLGIEENHFLAEMYDILLLLNNKDLNQLANVFSMIQELFWNNSEVTKKNVKTEFNEILDSVINNYQKEKEEAEQFNQFSNNIELPVQKTAPNEDGSSKE